jgi:hypothetical protein
MGQLRLTALRAGDQVHRAEGMVRSPCPLAHLAFLSNWLHRDAPVSTNHHYWRKDCSQAPLRLYNAS